MVSRTRRKFVIFKNSFELKAVGRVLPPGNYEVVTDEELVEGLSFPVYRRVSTMIVVPAARGHSTELLTVDPNQISAAEARDGATGAGTGRPPKEQR
jgi:hypothetical protein